MSQIRKGNSIRFYVAMFYTCPLYSSSIHIMYYLHPFFVVCCSSPISRTLWLSGYKVLTRPVCVTPALVVGIAQRHTIASVLTRVQLAWFDLFVAKPSHVSVLAFALEAVAASQNAFAKNAIAQITVGKRTERSCSIIYDISSDDGVSVIL